jgi:hypothetical protein
VRLGAGDGLAIGVNFTGVVWDLISMAEDARLAKEPYRSGHFW